MAEKAAAKARVDELRRKAVMALDVHGTDAHDQRFERLELEHRIGTAILDDQSTLAPTIEFVSQDVASVSQLPLVNDRRRDLDGDSMGCVAIKITGN